MKKLLLKTAVLALLVLTMITATAAAEYIGNGVVHADALRLRSEPNTHCPTLTCFPDGTQLEIYEKLDGWYRVKKGDLEGFVSSDYVSFAAAPQEETLPQGEEKGVYATINGSSVNFRQSPSTDAPVLGLFSRGNRVMLLEQEGDWCRIRYNGIQGYVSADFVSVEGMALQNPRGIVTGTGVNIRSGPGTDYGVLNQVTVGQKLDLVSLENGWYQVCFDGMEGYISAD